MYLHSPASHIIAPAALSVIGYGPCPRLSNKRTLTTLYLKAPKMSDSDKSSSSKDYSGKLPKLIVKGNTHNYGEWSIQSEIQLLGQGLWKYVVGPDSNPPAIPPLQLPFTQHGIDKHGAENEINVPGNANERKKAIADAKPWMEKNDYTRAVICKSLDNRQLHRVKHLQYASQVWESLRQQFIKPNSALANSNKNSLITYLCTPEMDVATWLDDMERLYDDLTDVDPDALSDHGYALLLMNNLPETTEWRSLAGGLRKRVEECNRTIPPTPVSSSEFITSIRDEYHFRNKNNPDTMAQIFTARYEANKDSRRPPKRNRPFDASSSNTSSTTTSKRPRIQKTCTNSSCGRNGHDTADCFAYGGPKQGAYPTWWKGPWNLHLPPSQRNPNTNKPPNPPPDKKPVISQSGQANSVVADSGTNSANLVVADTQDLTDPGTFPPSITYTDCGEPPNLIFITEDTSDPFVATVPFLHQDAPKTDICLYDSGANRHVFNDRAAFENYESIQPLSVKGFGDSLATTAVGRGSVRLRSKYGSRPSSFLLTNVLHIPIARSNLISGTQLATHGVVTTLGKRNIILTHNNIFILDGFVEKGMYRLNTTPIPPAPTLLSRITPTIATVHTTQADFYTA